MAYVDIPHLRSTPDAVTQVVKPSVAAGAGAGVGATVTSHTGGDECGQVVVTCAGTPAAGVLATITFATPYTVAPAAVSIDAGDAHSAAASLYATVSKTALTISYAGSNLVSGNALTLNYAVIGGA